MTLWEHQAELEEFLGKTPKSLSAFSFPTLYLWQEHFDYLFESCDGCLCVYAQSRLGRFLMLPPLASAVPLDVVREVFDRMEKYNQGSGVTRIENVPGDGLRYFPEEEFSRYNKGYEYLYYRPDLEHLRGNLYKSKRGSLNHFLRLYSAEFRPYEPAMRSECLALYDSWAAGRRERCLDAVYQDLLLENRGVHDLVFRDWPRLGLCGRVVIIDGKIVGYTFGFAQNRRVFCVLGEVADLSFPGLGVYIFRAFCADPQVRPYCFINAMEDLAFPGMARAKMSFRPSVLWPAYVITRRGPA